MRGDVERGPGGLNYPTTEDPPANKQTADKGRPGVGPGLPAPDSEAPTCLGFLRGASGFDTRWAARASCRGSRHLTARPTWPGFLRLRSG